MFTVGQQVIYKGQKDYGAKVVDVLPNDEYRVEFDDTHLIPPIMLVPGVSLRAKTLPSPWGFSVGYDMEVKEGSPTNLENCPKCGGSWKETWIGYNVYYDCLKCSLKREDV